MYHFNSDMRNVRKSVMKRITCILSVVTIVAVSACRKDGIKKGNVPLTGNWVAVQSLLDPGDGSGTWQPVQVKSTLQFFEGGTVGGSAFSTYAKYTVKDSVTLAFTGPDSIYQEYYYKISHDTLTMSPSFPNRCIEACGERFKKVN